MTLKHKKVTDEQLIYAAFERCSCGTGYATRRDNDNWECAAFLKGKRRHSEPKRKEMWNITEECTARAGTETTRPTK